MPVFINWNGEIIAEDKVCLSPDNHSFRYGDGCFETIKVINGSVPLLPWHIERLFSSLKLLQFSIPAFFTQDYIQTQILELVQKNNHEALARVRLTIYRNQHRDATPGFIIQSWQGDVLSNHLNTTGLTIGFYHDAMKHYDSFSALKSNNYLPYAMGALWAGKNDLDDCLLLNATGSIADATIANVFIVSGGILKTPDLQSGCINGVMRRYLLQALAKEGTPVTETVVFPGELAGATEVFLTNANYGIRWVKTTGNSTYANDLASLLHRKYIAPLFHATTF